MEPLVSASLRRKVWRSTWGETSICSSTDNRPFTWAAMRWMIAARPVSTTSGRPVSVAPAGGRGSAPSGSGWPWLSSEGTPGRAAPDCSGAAPWAGGAWIAGALAGGGSGGQSTQPAAGRVRHADGASRHAVRCAHSLRYASQRSSRRTGQRSAGVGVGWQSTGRGGAGLPPPRAWLPGTDWTWG